MSKKLSVLAFLILTLLAAGLACRFTAADPTATPVVVVETEEIEETEAPTPPPTEEPTTIEETETPVEPTEEEGFKDLVRLEKSLWIQDENTVFVSFFFENPNHNLIFEDVEYSVYLYGPNGEEIDSDTSYVRWIFPEQTFGIAFNFYLSDETVTVDSATVDWVYDDTYPAGDFTYPFVIQNVQYWENDGFPMVTGRINNEQAETYTDIRTNIICYNNAGQIVGGGYTYIDFIPGEDYMGFSSYIDAFDDVTSVDIYPTFSYNTIFYEDEDIWSVISVLDSYFYEGDYGDILGGALIRNESNSVLRSSILYATFYNEVGDVTSAGSARIGILLPGETLGVTPWVLSPPEGTSTMEFDVLVLPGEVEDGYELTTNPFVVNSTEVTGEYDNYVLVNFTNTYSKQVSDVDVYVQLYNAEGQIIGGGDNWTTDPIPAGGSVDIEVFVDYSKNKTVDRIEAWVVPSTFTTFE